MNLRKERLNWQRKSWHPYLHLFSRSHYEHSLKLNWTLQDSLLQKKGEERNTKRYPCLFTCLLCRVVHLEIADGMDTNLFLNDFYRMLNRRGLPPEVLSDNGTNIVGGNTELKELINNFEKNKIKMSTANKEIKWHFNVPFGPHLGCVFEI